MIFAAGLGTRLKPLTDTMPKALVTVGDKPLLQHVIERLQAAGFDRIVVNIHHFGQQIIDFLDAHDRFGLDIRISDEREALLDTGGAIKKARPLFAPDVPILIHNVDILSDLNLSAFYADASQPDALLAVSERKTSRYLLFDADSHLVGWTHTGTGELRGPVNPTEAPAMRHLAFAGIHLFHPRLFPLMDSWPDRFSIIDFYLHTCTTHIVLGHAAPFHLLDVGKLDTLVEADQFLKRL